MGRALIYQAFGSVFINNELSRNSFFSSLAESFGDSRTVKVRPAGGADSREAFTRGCDPNRVEWGRGHGNLGSRGEV